jgi:hypothetical protein
MAVMVEIDFTKRPAFHSTEEVLAHPRFAFARDEFVKAMLALYEHKPLLNRLLLEASRTVLGIVIISPQPYAARRSFVDEPGDPKA